MTTVVKSKRMFKKANAKKAIDADQIATKKYVKDQFKANQELKYYLFGTSGSIVLSNTPTVLLSPPQNDTDQGRSGDTIRLKSLQIRYDMVKNSSDAQISNKVRCIVFQWHPNTLNVIPANTQMFLNDYLTSALFYRSFYIKDNREQFTILYDKVHDLQGLPTNGSSPLTSKSSVVVDKFISLKKAKKIIQFSNGTVDGENLIFVTFLGNYTTNGPNVAFTSRINYTDS